MSDRVLTTAEAAGALGISVRTFLRRVDAGEIPVARRLPGTNPMLFDAAVIELLAAHNAITVRPYNRKPAKAAAT